MLKLFKNIAFLEGLSYLVILFNMLVVKVLSPDFYQILLKPFGMTHGVLFIAYVIIAILLKDKQNWTLKDLALILGASLIPFATFWVERKYCKNA